MGAPKENILDRRFLPAFQWLALAVCIAVALNYAAGWWFWEVRLPAFGLQGSASELFDARLLLCWSTSALVLGATLFDLVKSLPRMRHRSLALFYVALVFGLAPYALRGLLLP
jgi:hypothetical protein